MISEKLSLQFDVEKIREYFLSTVRNFEPVYQNGSFGGWSILSTSGDYRDGFQQGHLFFEKDPVTGQSKFNYERAHAEAGFTWPRMHVTQTQVGGGYVAEVIQHIRDLGLQPHRARWTTIGAGGATSWHRDMAERLYGVRLHVPVITNPDCAFETEDGAYHMAADGHCYLVAVNKVHRAYNNGSSERIHIIMDIVDSIGYSQHHTVEQHEIWLKTL